jgi:hypothetical protein
MTTSDHNTICSENLPNLKHKASNVKQVFTVFRDCTVFICWEGCEVIQVSLGLFTVQRKVKPVPILKTDTVMVMNTEGSAVTNRRTYNLRNRVNRPLFPGSQVDYITVWIYMPWRRMGEGKFSSIIFDLCTGWTWMVSFTLLPFYLRGKNLRYPLDTRVGRP